jgi:hypothetical protein
MNELFFFSSGIEGIITRALLVGNFEAAVKACIQADKMVWYHKHVFVSMLSLIT